MDRICGGLAAEEKGPFEVGASALGLT